MSYDSHILYRSRQIRAGMPKSDPVREAADDQYAWIDRIRPKYIGSVVAFLAFFFLTLYLASKH